MSEPHECDFVSCSLKHEQTPTVKQYDTGFKREEIGKPSYSIVPLEGLERIAARAMIGKLKYKEPDDDLNWKKADITNPTVQRRFLDAALRHLIQYSCGETDEDHLAAAAWNCMAIMALEKRAGTNKY